MKTKNQILKWSGFLAVILYTTLASTGANAENKAASSSPLRVFTCGHSFHYWMPPILSEVEAAAGIPVHQQVGRSGIGGSRVIQHWDADNHFLRLMDVVPFEAPPHEVVVGDVSNYDVVEKALTGMDALVITHVAPWGAERVNYETPHIPFQINVTGTAFLFHAALKRGVKKVVVISSLGVISDNPKTSEAQCRLSWPYRGKGYYCLTKSIQERIAEHFAHSEGMRVACIRPGYVLDGEKNLDKYGRAVGERNYSDTDRRDIGEVARLFLERDDLEFEIFHVLSTQESMDIADVRYTCERLNWRPRYDFSWLPAPGDVENKQLEQNTGNLFAKKLLSNGIFVYCAKKPNEKFRSNSQIQEIMRWTPKFRPEVKL